MTRCTTCDLQGRYRGRTLGHIDSPDFVFVFSHPPSQSGEQDKFLLGDSEKIFRAVAVQLGMTNSAIAFVCQCNPPGNRKPTNAELACCAPYLQEELHKMRPKLVVMFGNTVGSMLDPEFTNVSKRRNQIVPISTGHMGITTYSPDAIVLKDGYSLFPSFYRDMEKAYAYVFNVPNEYEFPKTTLVKVVTNKESFAYMLDDLQSCEVISYDWETTGLNPDIGAGMCLGLSGRQGEAYVLPIDFIRRHREEVKEFFNWTPHKFIAFNAVFDAMFNQAEGLAPRIDGDPMLEHYVLDERNQSRSLENLSIQFCNAIPYESKMLKEYDTNKAEFIDTIPHEVIYHYCGQDADYTRRLHTIFMQTIREDAYLSRLYEQIVVPSLQFVHDVHRNGIFVHVDEVTKLRDQYAIDLVEELEVLREMSGDPTFNPNSHQQTARVLWDEFGFEEPALFGRKDRSVDKDTRAALLKKYPNESFVEALTAYKSKEVAVTRYLDPILNYVDVDSRVRTSWHLDRTETGRMSTSKPPLHQIPRESGIRGLFGAPEGKVLVQADYAQIEMRMAAFLAGDMEFAEMFKDGVDFHTKMASEAYRIPVDKVTKEQRQAAKGVSFGLLFLMGVKKLADNTGLPSRQAYDFVAKYKALMPGVMEWIDEIKLQIKEHKVVHSYFGRRRRFPLILNSNIASIQRQAVNMPIQSSASDLTLISAMVINDLLKELNYDAKIILTVHDSIIVESSEQDAGKVAKMMHKIMTEPPFKSIVPFDVEIKIGQRWGEGMIWEGVE